MGYLICNALVLSCTQPYSFSIKDVLVGSDGLIEQVGNSISVPSSDYEKIDARGKALIPGLVNAHTHIAMGLLRGVGDDLQLGQWLENAIWPREAKMSQEDVKIGSLLGCVEMIRSGITCFNDMYFHMDAVAEAAALSGLRAVLGYSMIDRVKGEKKIEFDFDSKGKRELAQAKQFSKKLISKKNPLLVPSICPHAPNTCSKELLVESARLARELKLSLHIHAAETRKELIEVLSISKGKQAKSRNLSSLRPIDYLDSCMCLNSRTILAHAVYSSKSEVLLVAHRSASIAHCPVSNLKLAGGGAAPIPEFIKAGANISLGTDGAASNNSLNLFESMKVGAIEQKNFRFDASAVKADDYLRMATEGGAKALGLKAGRIEKGYLADLVLLDAKSANLVPFTNNAGWLVYAAGPHNVSDVMVNGKWVMRDRNLISLDEEKIIENAQKAASRLLS